MFGTAHSINKTGYFDITKNQANTLLISTYVQTVRYSIFFGTLSTRLALLSKAPLAILSLYDIVTV